MALEQRNVFLRAARDGDPQIRIRNSIIPHEVALLFFSLCGCVPYYSDTHQCIDEGVYGCLIRMQLA